MWDKGSLNWIFQCLTQTKQSASFDKTHQTFIVTAVSKKQDLWVGHEVFEGVAKGASTALKPIIAAVLSEKDFEWRNGWRSSDGGQLNQGRAIF